MQAARSRRCHRLHDTPPQSCRIAASEHGHKCGILRRRYAAHYYITFGTYGIVGYARLATGYVPTPLRGIRYPCPPAVMRHLSHLWAQCIDPIACVTYPICGRNISTPSHARSAYRSLACGKPRVAGDATGRMTHLHNHAASRRRNMGTSVVFCGAAMRHIII